MRVPESLAPLVDQGVIQEVIRPLMSGKEAQVFLVLSEDERRVAKVYKDASQRSFKHRADYTEGRKVRNTREMRAMGKRSRYGRKRVEAQWRNAEVDAIFRLRDAGVAVPIPYDFIEGVLIMELIQDEHGEPAPRLIDRKFTADEGMRVFRTLLTEVQLMLCAGVVHGDLSDFNVLMSERGPIIIDFPQAVDPAHNNNARKLLIRDVRNLTSFLARHTPQLKGKRFGEEMWDLYERGKLTPETVLTGKFKRSTKKVETSALLAEIEELERENRERRERLGLGPARPARKPVKVRGPTPRPVSAKGPPPAKTGGEGSSKKRRRKRKRRGEGRAPEPQKKTEDLDDIFGDIDALLIAED